MLEVESMVLTYGHLSTRWSVFTVGQKKEKKRRRRLVYGFTVKNKTKTGQVGKEGKELFGGWMDRWGRGGGRVGVLLNVI